jgi:rhodanese-related sulfurtransferase
MNILPKQAHEENLIILDVRTPAEYAAKHAPNSYNIPLDELEEHLLALKDMRQKVAIMCRTGLRATKAQTKIGRPPMKVQVIQGGMEAWEKEEYLVITQSGTWDMGRQVRFTAGLLVLIPTYLGTYVNAWWMALVAAVAIGLIYSGASGSCMMANVLAKMPWNKQAEHNTKEVLERLQNAA